MLEGGRETKKQRACWKSEIFFWELNSILMKILPFVLICNGCWSHEQKHSIITSTVMIISPFNVVLNGSSSSSGSHFCKECKM